MPFHEFIGLIAAALTTLSFIPQAIKVLKTRDTRSISLLMYSLFVSGVVIWIVYGVLIASLPIIIANFLTLIFASCILWVTIQNSWNSRNNIDTKRSAND